MFVLARISCLVPCFPKSWFNKVTNFCDKCIMLEKTLILGNTKCAYFGTANSET